MNNAFLSHRHQHKRNCETAGCRKPYIRWCGSGVRRNPVTPTRSDYTLPRHWEASWVVASMQWNGIEDLKTPIILDSTALHRGYLLHCYKFGRVPGQSTNQQFSLWKTFFQLLTTRQRFDTRGKEWSGLSFKFYTSRNTPKLPFRKYFLVPQVIR